MDRSSPIRNKNARILSFARLAARMTSNSMDAFDPDSKKVTDCLRDEPGSKSKKSYPNDADLSANLRQIEDKYSLEHQDQPFNFQTDLIPVAWRILYQGILGAMIFLLQLGSLTLIIVLAGHLDQPSLYVSAMGIGISYVAILSSIVWGKNAGFAVIVGRCIEAQNYKMLRRYFIRQIKTVNCLLLMTYVVFACLYVSFGWQYSDKPELLDWLRKFLLCVAPSLFFIYNEDVLREFHLGFSNYIASFLCEALSVFVSIFNVWLFAFYLEYQFYGILIGVFIGQFMGFCIYVINISYNSNFAVYHEKKVELTEKLNGDNKSDENFVGVLDNYWSYQKFSLPYAAIFFLENCWLRIDTIVASLMNEIGTDGVAALAAFYNVATMLDCFSFGFGYSMTTQLTKYQLNYEIKKAKVVACISFFAALVVSLALCIPIGYFSDSFARWFIAINGTSDVVGRPSNYTQNLLAELFRKYALILPLQLILVVFFSINKAQGKQNHHVIAQIQSEYLFHFTCLYFLYTSTELGTQAFVVNLGLTYGAMILCCATIGMGSDWRIESIRIRSENLGLMESEDGNQLEECVNGSNGILIQDCTKDELKQELFDSMAIGESGKNVNDGIFEKSNGIVRQLHFF